MQVATGLELGNPPEHGREWSLKAVGAVLESRGQSVRDFAVYSKPNIDCYQLM